ncbi:MAG: NAD-dependent epimerase/dehydratase family protein [Candidatus Marsarchaeota archaeon]|nr:NAD-dependent epimerase/dehydratase family protein [Candidatus Marsarchaeota archaeon]
MARILSLGGCGFIGSYITRSLLDAGHKVTAVDNFSKYGFVEHDFYKNRNFKLITKDVRNIYPKEFRDYDVVLCFAALIGGIKYFHKIPYQIARDNTEILNSAIDNTLSSSPSATFYYFSSSMVFERVQKPVTEQDARNQLVPITNYGMQKLFGEFITVGAHDEYGLNYVVVRPFNAVGSGELPHVNSNGKLEFGMAHVIPDFVYKAMIKQNPFEILGDGKQVRTFTHAKDIADAVTLMINKDIRNEDFNVCGNNTISMDELAKKVWRTVNKRLRFPAVKHVEAPKDDVRFRVGKSEKAMRVINWKPKYDLDYIIKDTYGFVKANFKKKKKEPK